MIIDKNDPRLAKLPKWAQQEFETLLQKVADAGSHIANLSLQGPEDTDTYVRDHVRDDIMLPPGSEVRFVLDADNHIEVRRMQYPGKAPFVSVRSSGSATQLLTVRPEQSNSIRISMEPR